MPPSSDFKKLARLVISKVKPGFDVSDVINSSLSLVKSHKLNVSHEKIDRVVDSPMPDPRPRSSSGRHFTPNILERPARPRATKKS